MSLAVDAIPQHLTTYELARILRLSPRTVAKWAAQGRIPSLRVSKKGFRFRWDRVEAALAVKPPSVTS